MNTAASSSSGHDIFADERERLWGLAYRICGTRSDADDVVQDAWLRWQRSVEAEIERPAAWLTTVTTRIAIDFLRGRRRRSANYVGPWLPEFISTPMAADPADLVSSLTVGFLMMLERLDPIERVVFLLADVFGEPFVDIASTVNRSEVACRQIASRARRRVRDPEPRRSVEPTECVRLAAAFAQAAQAGDLSGVEALLSETAVLLSDGGATVRAARRPVVGRQRVARFVVNIAKRSANAQLGAAVLNGEPALVVSRHNSVELALIVHVELTALGEDADATIDHLYILRNPDKLAAISTPRSA